MISRLFCRGCFAFALAFAGVVGVSSPAIAQNQGDGQSQRGEGRGQRGANLARMVEGLRAVLADLKLDESQKARTDQILLDTRDQIQKAMQDPNTEPRDKVQAVRAEFQKAQADIRNQLSDEQKKTFDAGMEKLRAELTQGRGGMQLVQRVERALATVELTDEQKSGTQAVLDDATKQLEAIREEARNNGDPASIREKSQALREQVVTKLGEILSPEQMTKLREAMNADRPNGPGGRQGGAGPQTRSEPPPATTTANEAGNAGLSASDDSQFEPISVGDKVPPFSLVQLNGKLLDNAALANKPAVLLFGSYSSPALRDRIEKFQDLSEKTRNRATFVLIYTAEMYPADTDQPARNKSDKISVAAHKSSSERADAARTARDALKIKLDIAPDTMNAMLQKTLGVGANGAAVVKADGTLAFRQDWADAYAIERALAEAK
jgi:thiol-disulfide isomerase/thioredoxin